MRDQLLLTQWLSPAFPVGAFAYSSGLETAIAEGAVADEAGLRDWLITLTGQGSARVDAGLCALAHRGQDVTAIARAMAASRERSEEAEAQGAAFARTLGEMGRDIKAAPLPVSVGVAARDLEVPTRIVVALFLQAYLSNLVTIAVRAVPLGQSAGQRVLAGLTETVEAVANWSTSVEVDDLWSAGFGADLAAMRHERQEVRIYRT